jgi:hypothetical protein
MKLTKGMKFRANEDIIELNRDDFESAENTMYAPLSSLQFKVKKGETVEALGYVREDDIISIKIEEGIYIPIQYFNLLKFNPKPKK